MKTQYLLRNLVFICVLATALPLTAASQDARLSEAWQKMSPAIALLTGVDDKGQSLPVSSAFIVRPGVIVTSYDVIKDAAMIEAKLPGGRGKRANLFAVDRQRSVALLRVSGFTADPYHCPGVFHPETRCTLSEVSQRPNQP